MPMFAYCALYIAQAHRSAAFFSKYKNFVRFYHANFLKTLLTFSALMYDNYNYKLVVGMCINCDVYL
jgi:hypothetical protein